MSIKYTMNFNLNTPGGVVDKAVPATAEAIIEMDVAFPLANDTLVNFAVDAARIKCIYLVSDKALTIETNDGTAPDQTITLAADVPVLWIDGGPGENPITEDVTALYLSAAAAGNLKIRCLYDPTPSV